MGSLRRCTELKDLGAILLSESVASKTETEHLADRIRAWIGEASANSCAQAGPFAIAIRSLMVALRQKAEELSKPEA